MELDLLTRQKIQALNNSRANINRWFKERHSGVGEADSYRACIRQEIKKLRTNQKAFK